MKRLKLVAKHLHVLTLIWVAIGFLIIPCAYNSEQLLRNIFIRMNAEFLDNKYVTYANYYGCIFILWIFLSDCIFAAYCKWKFFDIPKMDAKYLKEVLKNDNPNLPAVSREDLLLKVVGEKNAIKNTYERTIAGYIDSNIEPIKKFIENKTGNVLIIDSAWGTGKTSCVMIAIDEFEKDKNDDNRRYIYESAFKYASGLSEFIGDVINAVKDALMLEGVNIEKQSKAVIRNLDKDPAKFLFSYMKGGDNIALSSSLIYGMNNEYKKKKSAIQIIIILDDTDRLLAEDIIKVLSLLSLLRRLSFVKIIIPAELKAVIFQLEQAKVYDPAKFTQKYLPEQATLKLKTEFDMIEKIALAAIRSKTSSKNKQTDVFIPIWEAVIFKLLSEKINSKLSKNQNYHYNWLVTSGVPERAEGKDWLSGEVLILTNAPGYFYRHTEKIITGPNGYGDYTWIASLTVKEFQNVIYMLKRNNGRSRVCDSFTDTDYQKVIASWIRDFARANWRHLGITLRDVLNAIRGDMKIVLSASKAKTFAETFNDFFPQSYLKAVESDTIND